MKNKKRIPALLLLASLLLSLISGCGAKKALTVGVESLTGDFSPFFAKKEGDFAVCELTQEMLLTTDRSGSVVYQAIEGETRLTGETEYSYSGLAEVSVEQEDGETTYTFTLRKNARFSDGEAVTSDDLIFSWYVCLDPSYNGPWRVAEAPIVGLRDYQTQTTEEVFEKYAERFDAIYQDPGSCEAAQVEEWESFLAKKFKAGGYAERFADDYEDARALWRGEGTAFEGLYEQWRYDYICEIGAADPSLTMNGVPSVTGIRRISDHEVSITLEGYDPDDILLLNVPVAPLHFYGDETLYRYDEGSFGFSFGDLSAIKDISGVCCGAGSYELKSFTGTKAELTASSRCWRGKSETKAITILRVSDPVQALCDGTIDLAAPALTAQVEASLENANDGALSGKTIAALTYAEGNSFFVGINAQRVNVGGMANSSASIALRHALTVLISYCRESVTADEFSARAVCEYTPLAPESWACAAVEAGARDLTALDGSAIYPAHGDEEKRHDAALSAAVDYFVAAGYRYENGRLVSAPQGASLSYTVILPAEREAESVSLALMQDVKYMLYEIGITLLISEVGEEDYQAILGENLQDIWCGERDCTDALAFFHTWEEGTGSNYGISSTELSTLLEALEGNLSYEQRTEKAAKALALIDSWAIEVPIYQKLGCVLYAPSRIGDGLEAVSAFYSWTQCAREIEMK